MFSYKVRKKEVIHLKLLNQLFNYTKTCIIYISDKFQLIIFALLFLVMSIFLTHSENIPTQLRTQM